MPPQTRRAESPAFTAYVICTAPRSGSTLLSGLLRATGLAGNPTSLFYLPKLDDWIERLGLAPRSGTPEPEVLRAILAAAIRDGSGGGPVFALRQQRHGFAFLCEKLAVLFPQAECQADLFRLAFGPTLFIHLARPDKVAQAVSLVIAEQTGLWHAAPDGTEIELLAPHREPVYDAAALRARLAALTAWDRDWNDWFAREGIAPLRLAYDDLAANPAATLRRVLSGLGLPTSAAYHVTPGLRRLADDTSKRWAARLRAEAAAPGPPDP